MANLRRLLLMTLAATLSIALAACSPAKDDGLKALKTKLTALRKLPSPRDEDVFPPTYFEARDDLRDWVENHLSTLAEKGGDFEFATTLNQQLKDAKLICNQCAGATGGFADGTGYVGEVRATRAGQDLLEVTTSLGVQCGYDETPYLYRFEDGKWRRVWEGAQAADDKGKYEPRRLETVRLSRTGDANDRQLVLTLAHFQGCQPAEWKPVFYGLWSMAEGEKPQNLLVAERALAYTGNTRNAPIYARLSGDEDLLVEYAAKSIDPSIHDRVKIEHFRIYPDKVEKIVPFALTPRDFVEEWLTGPWETAQTMTADEARGSLADQHKQFHTDRLSIKFDGPTMACPATKTPGANVPSMRLYTVQVHVAFHNLKQLPEDQRYFRIKWVPPYMFELTDMTDNPAKDCTDPEPAVDYKPSLFGRRR
jgi:hypothetical protein